MPCTATLTTLPCFNAFAHPSCPSCTTHSRTPHPTNATLSTTQVVEKHTAYAKYMRQRQQGLAPLAVNWEQVKDRHTHHQKATDMLRDVLRRFDAEVQHSV